MRIVIETIPHEKQRYPSAGDWTFEPDGTLRISVSDTGFHHHNLLLGFHELVEAVLCARAGISQQLVDAFDMSHPDEPDPAMHKDSPYMRQHVAATSVEMLMATLLGVDWLAYEQALEAL